MRSAPRTGGRWFAPPNAGFASAWCSMPTHPTATRRPLGTLTAAGAECRVAGVGADAAHGKAADRRRDGGRRDREPHLAGRTAGSPSAAASGGAPLAGTREWWVTAARVAAAAPRCARGLRRPLDGGDGTTAPVGRRGHGGPRLHAPAIGTPMPQVAPQRLCAPLGPAGPGHRRSGGGRDAGSDGRHRPTAGAGRPSRTRVPDAPAASESVLDGMAAASSRGALPARSCSAVSPIRSMPTQLAVAAVPGPPDGPGVARRPGTPRALVADGAVLVSSANWSAAGLGGNWEAALRVDHPAAAAYYAAAWRRDWDYRARPSTFDAERPGYSVRMPDVELPGARRSRSRSGPSQRR